MDLDPIRSLAILENRSAPRRERRKSAHELAVWARIRSVDPDQARNVLRRVVGFWRELCEAGRDELSWELLLDRTLVAAACTLLSRGLSDAPRFFRNIPLVPDAEGPHPRNQGKLIRGSLSYTYRSIYEFHWEYPIEGFGVRKDLITVVGPDDTRLPLLPWLEERRWVVWCSGCGLEVTTEISRDCPARELRRRGGR